MPKRVEFGPVVTFNNVYADKEQAVKILEEAAEVFGAWQQRSANTDPENDLAAVSDILDECCDVVQAVANLCAALGKYDMTAKMQNCKQRNINRGRIKF